MKLTASVFIFVLISLPLFDNAKASKDYKKIPKVMPACSAVYRAIGHIEVFPYHGDSVSHESYSTALFSDRFSQVRKEFLDDSMQLIYDMSKMLSLIDTYRGAGQNQVRSLYAVLTASNNPHGRREMLTLAGNFHMLLRKIEGEEGASFLAHALRAGVWANLKGATMPIPEPGMSGEVNHRNAIMGIGQDLILMTHLFHSKTIDSLDYETPSKRILFTGANPLVKVLNNVSNVRMDRYRRLYLQAIRETEDPGVVLLGVPPKQLTSGRPQIP
jgi:hypothetical protein